MTERFKILENIHLPAWEDLPQLELYNEQVCDYVSEQLQVFFPEERALSSTRVQNYIKWGILPKPKGRRYTREHIAWCIVITLFKTILPIKDVRKGILLQKSMMPIEQSYNSFIELLHESLKAHAEVLRDLKREEFVFEAQSYRREVLVLALAVDAFVKQFLTSYLLKENGLFADSKEIL